MRSRLLFGFLTLMPSAIPALDAFMQRNTLLIVMVAAGSAIVLVA